MRTSIQESFWFWFLNRLFQEDLKDYFCIETENVRQYLNYLRLNYLTYYFSLFLKTKALKKNIIESEKHSHFKTVEVWRNFSPKLREM